jgi:acetoin utilization protein AcuB
MYIANYMTSDPITAAPELLLPEARRLLNENDIRHLPVVDGEKRLIGIVSDRDLRSAYPSSVMSRSEKILTFEQVEKTTVADIMTTDCSTLELDATLDDALVIFDSGKIGVIPVVNESGTIVGIFSLMDLNAAYHSLFGIAEPGSVLIGIKDDGRDNMFSEIALLLEQNNIALTSILRGKEKKDRGKIYVRIVSAKPFEARKILKHHGFILTSY